MMEVYIFLVGILLITCFADAQTDYYTTPAQEKPAVPGSLGKYFVYVNCTDCSVDSDLVVVEGKGKKTTVDEKTQMRVNDRHDDWRRGRPKVPKRPNVPKPWPPGQRGRPKRPSTKGILFDKLPPIIKEYYDPNLPEYNQDSCEDSILECSLYEDPSSKVFSYENPFIKEMFAEYSVIEDKEPDFPFEESPSKSARTEKYVNPFLPDEANQFLDEILWLLDYVAFDNQFKDEYADLFPPISVTPVYKRTRPMSVTPVFTRTFPPGYKRTRPVSVTPAFTRIWAKMARTGKYVNPFLPKDSQDLDDEYDFDENPDLQFFKDLIVKKYENDVFRYADLHGKPNEKGSFGDKEFCVYESAGTYEYSFKKPCKIISSPENKVNMKPLICHQFSKSKICLVKVECPPPSPLESKANECVEQIILRKQNIIAVDKKNSEDRFKRQDPRYNSEKQILSEKTDSSSVPKG